MDIVLSSRNPEKIDRIRKTFQGLPLHILSLADAGVIGDVEENGATLTENALKKALHAWVQRKGWSLADDSGLYIDALGGRPGIWTTRWAGVNASADSVTRHTLDLLSGVPRDERTALFRTIAVLINPSCEKFIFMGEVAGVILTEPRMSRQQNMPYSTIFVPDGHTRAWAEMSEEEESALSHRGQAFRQVREFLEKRL